ncbi:MAG: RnfABCDGE type electron transport complex subunit B [Cellulosilyticaceae bacterium]
MNIFDVLNPVLAIGGLGLLFGVGLGVAAKKFAVPVDERVGAVKEHLPGANCGGCGFAGCEAFAKAVVAGDAKVMGCPVCNDEQVSAIATVMGQEAITSVQCKAFVKCKGHLVVAPFKYHYSGVTSCEQAQLIGGGPKKCSYGCLGFGSCAMKCAFDAITIEDGLAIVDQTKCTGCGSCIAACPRKIIELKPESTRYRVACASQEKGKEVKATCEVGCIGCSLCIKQCESQAISLVGNCAVIDPELCTKCGKCEAKCPTHAIIQR